MRRAPRRFQRRSRARARRRSHSQGPEGGGAAARTDEGRGRGEGRGEAQHPGVHARGLGHGHGDGDDGGHGGDLRDHQVVPIALSGGDDEAAVPATAGSSASAGHAAVAAAGRTAHLLRLAAERPAWICRTTPTTAAPAANRAGRNHGTARRTAIRARRAAPRSRVASPVRLPEAGRGPLGGTQTTGPSQAWQAG